MVEGKCRQFNWLSLNLMNNSRGKSERAAVSAEPVRNKGCDSSIWKTSIIRATFETSSRLTRRANVILVDCQAEEATGDADGSFNKHIIKT